MADKTLQLTVKVNSDTGKLEVLGAEMGKLGQKTKESADQFGSLSKALGSVVTAGAIIKFFKDSVAAAEEETQAINRLKLALESSGVSWRTASGSVQQWANEIQKATRFSDTDAYNAVGKLVRITGDLTQAQKASQLAMSLAVATGKSLGDTTQLVTDLINKNSRGVMAARKEFGDLVPATASAQQALDILVQKFGDAAVKEDSLTQKTASLKNQFGDLMEQVGNGVTPVIEKLIHFASNGIKVFQQFALQLADAGAQALAYSEAIAAGVYAIVRGRFKDIERIKQDLSVKLQAIEEETVAATGQIWQEQANTFKSLSNERIAVTQNQSKEEATEYAKLQEEKRKEDEKRAREHEADLQRAVELTAQMEQQILSIDANSYEAKKRLLDAETADQRRQINSTIKDQTAKQKALSTLDTLHLKRSHALALAETKINREKALDAVETGLQALSIINSMQSGHTKAQVTRARVILALEKSIAIARLWAAEAGKGLAGIGMAAAGTALIVAQFAQQSRAIGDAAKVADQGSQEFKVETPLGNGGTLIETSGGSSGAGSSAATSTGGAGGATTSPTAPIGGGGGIGAPAALPVGGGSTVNVGGITVNLDIQSLDMSSTEVVMRKIREAVLSGAVEGIKMAVALQNAADKNSGLAV